MFSAYYTDMDVDVVLCRHGGIDKDRLQIGKRAGPVVPSSLCKKILSGAW